MTLESTFNVERFQGKELPVDLWSYSFIHSIRQEICPRLYRFIPNYIGGCLEAAGLSEAVECSVTSDDHNGQGCTSHPPLGRCLEGTERRYC